MARTSSKMTVLFNLFLVLSLCFTVSMAERILKSDTSISTGLTCESVYGVKSGDTCLGVANMFKLTQESISVFNPNLNCDKLFVGQWLCTSAVFF
ncbi:hypothetical protein BT93_L2448 [Corymbia citriodora subsp. variegata]|uniref:LysM domain-containing protein n=1 Tax=Corymbia citriodora subsp. variegata TaxID=360336 RepID=A0A8T0CMA3_CORYI|nr:hypothetical protein BT93_L2448 [Corymbia citriodora subsp. variegata]